MLFLQAWLLFPLVLVLLSLGGGLLLARVAGDALPSGLVLPTGFALLVLRGGPATNAPATPARPRARRARGAAPRRRRGCRLRRRTPPAARPARPRPRRAVAGGGRAAAG